MAEIMQGTTNGEWSVGDKNCPECHKLRDKWADAQMKRSEYKADAAEAKFKLKREHARADDLQSRLAAVETELAEEREQREKAEGLLTEAETYMLGLQGIIVTHRFMPGCGDLLQKIAAYRAGKGVAGE